MVEKLVQVLLEGFDLAEAKALARGLKELSEGSESYLVGVINQMPFRRSRPPAEIRVDRVVHWIQDQRSTTGPGTRSS
jgi:hypothetical protein